MNHIINYETITCEQRKITPYHTFNNQVNSCWNALQASRKLAVYQGLIQLTGSIKTAIMLSQLLYWTRVSTEVSERDGWLYKTIAEMELETGLTKREQGLCKEKLYELNLIRTSRTGVGARLAFKVNLDELALGICRLYHCDPNSLPPLTIDDIQNSNVLVYRQFFASRFVYHRDLVDLTGCLNAAVMLSQMFNIASRNLNSANEAKQHICSNISIVEWEKALGLSHKSQLNARNKLKTLKFIFEKNLQGDRRIFTFINAKVILGALKSQIKPKNTLPFSPPPRVKAHYKQVAETPLIQKYPMSNIPNVTSHHKEEKKGKMDNAKREEWNVQKGKNEQPCGLQPVSHSFSSLSKNDIILPISEVTKGKVEKLQNGKFGSYQSGSSEVTKVGILYYSNYISFNNYNYKYGVLPSNFEWRNTNNSVVGVVVDDSHVKGEGEENTDNQKIQNELILPSCFTGTEEQVWEIIQKQCMHIHTNRLQEILDEIAAQNALASPFGLLVKLIALEKSGQLICTKAHLVRQKRKQQSSVKQQNTDVVLNAVTQDEWSQLPKKTKLRHADGSIWEKDANGFLHCFETRTSAIPMQIMQWLKHGKLTLLTSHAASSLNSSN